MKKWLIIILVALSSLWAIGHAKHAPQISGVTPTPTATPSYFAEVDANGNVLRVIVVTQQVLNTGAFGDPKNWVQTFPDGSQRKNYAGKGSKYDKATDAFIPPKPSFAPNSVLDPVKDVWVDPSPTP